MASRRGIRRKSCERKRRYPDAASALAAARAYRRDFAGDAWRGRVGSGAYACQFCGGYHVGHRSRKSAQAANARREASG
jgi:hypothetical protein